MLTTVCRSRLLQQCSTLPSRVRNWSCETPPTDDRIQYLDRDNGGRMGYYRLTGKPTGLLYIPGYFGCPLGPKPLMMADYCRDNGHAFLSINLQGWNYSNSVHVRDCSFATWVGDALSAFDKLTEGRQVIVGSSFGGWVATLLALKRPERTAGLITIAPGLDTMFEYKDTKPEIKQELNETGEFVFQMTDRSDVDAVLITDHAAEESREYALLDATIDIRCPVRVIHSLNDADVHYSYGVRMIDRITPDNNDVKMTLLPRSGHNLLDNIGMSTITDTLHELMTTC